MPRKSAAVSHTWSCEWKVTSGSRSAREMQRNTPAANDRAQPITTSWSPVSAPRPQTKPMAPSGHIRAKTLLAIRAARFDQPPEAIREVMDRASSGL